MQAHLAYIQGLGCDALWISPIVKNPQGTYSGFQPYHGYHPQDFYAVEPRFGGAAALHGLLGALRSRGMFSMIDVVTNHAAPYVPLESLAPPFNAPRFFHDCQGCAAYCNIPPDAFPSEPGFNLTLLEHCRLADLPDLNQTMVECCRSFLRWCLFLIGFCVCVRAN